MSIWKLYPSHIIVFERIFQKPFQKESWYHQHKLDDTFLNQFGSDKCSKENCTICNYTNKSCFLKYKQIYIPFQNNSNCSSIGVVYIIKCKKCNIFYIGETGKQASCRIKEHLYSIKFFKNNVNKCLSKFSSLSEVAIHFGFNTHTLDDFNFYVFDSNLIEITKRKSIETNLINFFLKLDIPILNKKVPNFEKINNFCFLK